MTRAQFLNDLYRRLGALSREQAEQHLTYYAEMLADRMEEGMTEEEAVASMEAVETIAQRILQDEGAPPAPPRYPDPSGIRTGGPANTPALPERNRDWRRPAKYALWALALLVAGGMLFNRFAGHSQNRTADPMDSTTALQEDVVTDRSHHGISIGPDGIEVGGGISVGPDGVRVGDGEHSVYLGPGGLEVDGELVDWGDWHDWGSWDSWEAWSGEEYTFYGTEYTVPASGIEEVKIEWPAGMVEIAPQEEEHTIFFYEASTGELTNETQLLYVVDDETLYIRFAQPKFTVRDAKKLMLYLPDNWLEELEVETASAGVAISSLSVGDLDVDTASGCVALSGVRAKSMDISTTSGDVALGSVAAAKLEVDTTSGNVGGVAEANECKVDTTSGNVQVQGMSGRKYRLDSVSGELSLTLDGEGPFDVEVDTTSGGIVLAMPGQLEFSLDFETVSGSIDPGGFSLSGGSGGKYVCGSGPSQIEVDTTSGNLRLVQN